MSTSPDGPREKGNTHIHVTATEKGDTTWYAISALIIALLLFAYLMLNVYGLIPYRSYNAMFTSDMLNIFSTLVFLTASALALLKSKNLKIGRGILAFTISALLYFIAEVARAAYDFILNMEAPSPSAADVFYIMGSAMFIIALLLVIKSLTGKARIGLPVIVATAVGSALLAGALYYLSHGLSLDSVDLPTIIDISYPVLDLIPLIFVMLLLVVSLNKGVAQAHIILAAGVSVVFISDITFALGTFTGQYSNGSIADFLFAGGCILFAISVWRYVGLTKSDILDDRLFRLKKKAISR